MYFIVDYERERETIVVHFNHNQVSVPCSGGNLG